MAYPIEGSRVLWTPFLYALGKERIESENARLHHGDCLELMKDIPDGSIDMVLCDLPYGVTDCGWDSIIPFEDLWKEYRRVTKANGAVVLFAAQPFTTKLIQSNLRDFRYCWYWRKNNATGGLFCKYQPMRCMEDICVFYGKAPKYNPQGLVELERPKVNRADRNQNVYGGKRNDSVQRFTGYPKNLLEFDRERMIFHPTQKPVELLEYLIRTYTDEGDTVLDNCMGSGSTGVACVNTDRRFIGIEKEERYFDIAKKRISED